MIAREIHLHAWVLLFEFCLFSRLHYTMTMKKIVEILLIGTFQQMSLVASNPFVSKHHLLEA